MKINILKVAFVVAVTMVSGINVFNTQKTQVLSDIALANVEALASGESSGREDCDPNGIECSMLVIFPDGDWGEDIVLGEKKKAGWL